MSRSLQELQDIGESVLEIHEISKFNLIAIHIATIYGKQFATSRLSSTGRAEYISNEDDNRVFAAASIFKIFIATAITLMIEKLPAVPGLGNRYHGLEGAWDITFTDTFNKHNELNKFGKKVAMKPLNGNPTLRDLLIHTKGPCDINHLFLAPDGSPLLSENDFLNNLPQYTQDTRQQEESSAVWCGYSNANYILIALLIEVVSGTSLYAFLKEHIFNPLGMNHTYMTAEELELLPIIERPQPHVVSSNGHLRMLKFESFPYLADTVEIATLGGYISAADLGIFFTAVMDGLYADVTNTLFDYKLCKALFTGMGSLDGEKRGYTPLGLCTKLNTTLPGSHSLNRMISPKSDSVNYVLGDMAKDRQVEAYYLAGSATGWSSTAYFLPTKHIYVIVFCNSSGPLDASDLISRLCLQEILNLRPAKLGEQKITLLGNISDSMSQAQKYRAHCVGLANQMFNENKIGCGDLELEDSVPDTKIADFSNICGRYSHTTSMQSLLIDLETDKDQKGLLRITLQGESKTSRPMRFVRTDRGYRICSLVKNDSPGLAIDCHGDWKVLEFEVKEVDGIVTRLSRRGKNMVDHFDRIDVLQ